MLIKVLTLVGVFVFSKSWAQVNIVSTSYTQNFGTSNITSWTNNSTFPGWYIGGGTATFQGYANFGSPVNGFNGGGFYSYNCGSGDFASIGGRGSGNACCGNLYYGVVLRNTTGLPIQSIRVSYRGYQMSLAQNGGNPNTAVFQYSVNTSAPPIAGGGTSFAALNFTAPSSTVTSGGNQINWFPCNNFVDISACIPLTVPNNSYVLLRWYEQDDGGNDHHMAVDNVRFDFGITANDCSIILPIELLDFYATKNNSVNDIVWKVSAEEDLDYYSIEKSNNGVDFYELDRILFNAQTSNLNSVTYSIKDNSPYDDITYYRLSTKDKNGQFKYYKTIYIEGNSVESKSNHYQRDHELVVEFKNLVPKNSSITLFDLSGKLMVEEVVKESQTVINTQAFAEGIYFMRISTPYKTENFKLIIQK